MSEDIGPNIARIQERIAAAAKRSGRPPEEITLLAVTKKQPTSAVLAALSAGILDIGENYVQEALAKREEISPGERGAARWHLLGHLQTNKAKQVVSNFDLIQSVDSLRLAQTLARQAQSLGETQAILLQVHLGDEVTKSGLAPGDLMDVAAQAAALDGLELRGLMGIAPFGVDPRPHFALLRAFYEKLPAANRRTLSMGMTGDFEVAIEEGATMVRIGTAIFGQRQ